MSNITNIEKMKLERLLGMGSGYVLDLSNQKFQDFIYSSVSVDIWGDKYSYASGSKANRLRAFWEKESNHLAGKLLSELLEYWRTKRLIDGVTISTNDQILFEECQNISTRLLGVQAPKQPEQVSSEDEFINREFKDVTLNKLDLDNAIIEALSQRIDEIKKCLSSKSPLATIFLCGSTLEGILLGIATKYPSKFNQSKCAPQKDGKVMPFHNWSLSNFIDTAGDLRILGDDVRKHSHALKDFRNFIHPYQQVATGFNPHEHTAKISWQVLRAAIYEIGIFNEK